MFILEFNSLYIIPRNVGFILYKGVYWVKHKFLNCKLLKLHDVIANLQYNNNYRTDHTTFSMRLYYPVVNLVDITTGLSWPPLIMTDCNFSMETHNFHWNMQ